MSLQCIHLISRISQIKTGEINFFRLPEIFFLKKFFIFIYHGFAQLGKTRLFFFTIDKVLAK